MAAQKKHVHAKLKSNAHLLQKARVFMVSAAACAAPPLAWSCSAGRPAGRAMRAAAATARSTCVRASAALRQGARAPPCGGLTAAGPLLRASAPGLCRAQGAPVATTTPEAGGATQGGYPFAEIEARWQAYWEANKTFRTPEKAPPCVIRTPFSPRHCLFLWPHRKVFFG